MDKQRDQASNNRGAKDFCFTNSAMEDNLPSNDGSENAGANDDRPVRTPERTSGYSEGGRTPGKIAYPLPPDPHAPPGYPEDGGSNEDSAEISDQGLNEKVEVGYSPNQLNYGIKK